MNQEKYLEKMIPKIKEPITPSLELAGRSIGK
jgi:hypothetical protein